MTSTKTEPLVHVVERDELQLEEEEEQTMQQLTTQMAEATLDEEEDSWEEEAMKCGGMVTSSGALKSLAEKARYDPQACKVFVEQVWDDYDMLSHFTPEPQTKDTKTITTADVDACIGVDHSLLTTPHDGDGKTHAFTTCGKGASHAGFTIAQAGPLTVATFATEQSEQAGRQAPVRRPVTYDSQLQGALLQVALMPETSTELCCAAASSSDGPTLEALACLHAKHAGLTLPDGESFADTVQRLPEFGAVVLQRFPFLMQICAEHGPETTLNSIAAPLVQLIESRGRRLSPLPRLPYGMMGDFDVRQNTDPDSVAGIKKAVEPATTITLRSMTASAEWHQSTLPCEFGVHGLFGGAGGAWRLERHRLVTEDNWFSGRPALMRAYPDDRGNDMRVPNWAQYNCLPRIRSDVVSTSWGEDFLFMCQTKPVHVREEEPKRDTGTLTVISLRTVTAKAQTEAPVPYAIEGFPECTAIAVSKCYIVILTLDGAVVCIPWSLEPLTIDPKRARVMIIPDATSISFDDNRGSSRSANILLVGTGSGFVHAIFLLGMAPLWMCSAWSGCALPITAIQARNHRLLCTLADGTVTLTFLPDDTKAPLNVMTHPVFLHNDPHTIACRFKANVCVVFVANESDRTISDTNTSNAEDGLFFIDLTTGKKAYHISVPRTNTTEGADPGRARLARAFRSPSPSLRFVHGAWGYVQAVAPSDFGFARTWAAPLTPQQMKSLYSNS